MRDEPPLSVTAKNVYGKLIAAELVKQKAEVGDLARILWDITPKHSVWRSRRARIKAWMDNKQIPDAEDTERLKLAFERGNWKNGEAPVIAEPTPEPQPETELEAAMPLLIDVPAPEVAAPEPPPVKVNTLSFKLGDTVVDVFQYPDSEERFNIILTAVSMKHMTLILAALQDL